MLQTALGATGSVPAMSASRLSPARPLPAIAFPQHRCSSRQRPFAAGAERTQHVRGLVHGTARRAGDQAHRLTAWARSFCAARAAEGVATGVGNRTLDVRVHLTAPAYLVPATAFRVLAVQAGLVPNDHVSEVVETAFDVLRRQRAGELRDTGIFPPSLAAEALKVLAALSIRLTTEQAERLLYYVRRPVSRSGQVVGQSVDDELEPEPELVGQRDRQVRGRGHSGGIALGIKRAAELADVLVLRLVGHTAGT